MEIAGVFVFLAFLMTGLFGLASIAFWIWMIVDCASNEPSEGNDKIVWLLVIILLQPLLGPLLYFFIRRPKRMTEVGV